MPELPEVETVKQTLNTLVAGKRIERVTVTLPRIIQRPLEIEQFCDALQGHTIERVERRGKFLRILLDGLVLVSHLRMEGRYGVYKADEPVEKHTHVIFHFDDGTELRYKDVRQFGTMHLFVAGEEWELPPLHKLGVEPLSAEFTVERFAEAMRRRRSFIKPVLLNQHIVVGIGNIYVDEALFRAGIHPNRAADELTDEEYALLHRSIIDTLQEAVEAGGSSIKSYVNGQGEMGMFQHQLQMYGRQGEPCVRCGSIIEKSVVGGRGTHYCPKCQQLS
ncbi:DNA-formamidopyrimidine glycosylase [Paenibacillus alvei]|uniref:Formamidopyrimidine-DNA glycosylase n=1 Tax=Paenibacillus alvei TaxID=44250 RepID=A0AAP7A682_PAEAL|nr:DNA-formamidopyrimidine glycosylase [Paenibacillus alvei]MBG9732841.1 5-hydroxymethyluracil DNA glycosylase [Paenibacillus alvei]MBG9745388.1 5-hydroxymethyluracil DNA glycosylase [Paenibacillus alvei]MCY9582523.1 DNA-formamidopyrimidine glycosylase [Paenibacillus alvei]MCY9583620.1 DNA-formamidopyrimidine glycosylase [Paenibacillus alvei]NOJ73693.1 DNA-formamidopyrimidine glycosylase [Paenibacillus alvei]